MSEDLILDELHRVREALATRFDHDLEAIGRYLMNRERLEERAAVAFPPKRVPEIVPPVPSDDEKS